MHYLVTGAAGFIGAAVAERLMAEGHTVVTIDNLSTGYVEHVPKGAVFIQGSVADRNVLSQVTDKTFDAIIHIAGQSSGEISFEDPVYDLQTNTQSTLLLLDLARRIGCKKFIYASTMSVYGDHQPPQCKENAVNLPKSFYAVGKIASEHYMRIYAEQFGIACTALRLFNTYGIGQNLRNLKQGMASIYLAMAINDHRIVVKGSKDRFRDFVYIDDVVGAIVKSLDRTEYYDVFNVCTGKATTVETVVKTICDFLPYEVQVEYTEGTPGDQFGIFGDNEKIQRVMGWKPKVEFMDGMKRMVEWAVKAAI